jgi:hypothetical protein
MFIKDEFICTETKFISDSAMIVKEIGQNSIHTWIFQESKNILNAQSIPLSFLILNNLHPPSTEFTSKKFRLHFQNISKSHLWTFLTQINQHHPLTEKALSPTAQVLPSLAKRTKNLDFPIKIHLKTPVFDYFSNFLFQDFIQLV